MADVKISGLTAISAVEDNDLLEVSEDTGSGYASRKATAAQLKTYALGSVNVSFTGPTAPRTYTLPDANGTLLTGNQTISLSGDASGSGATAITVTLANSGVTAGTYKSVTVDGKGRVTAGTNPTTLAGYGISDAAPSSHVGATGAAHGVATTSVAGFMSAADKTKLDGVASGATANTGTVTSVALSLPNVFSVSGSPVTTSGTLTASLASQTANTIFAAPNGTAGAPAFRSIVAADIPTLNQNTTGTASNVTGTVALANGGTGATTAADARSNLGLTIGSNVQAYDADLAAIAAISGTSGLLRKTAANTWSLETSSYLTGNQTISLSGDVSGSGSTSISATLANSGVTAGTYTNATVTVDAKGRVTSASSGAASGVTSFSAGTTGLTPSTAATGAVTLAGTLALANGGTGSTTASGARTNLGLAIGSNVQAYDADLAAIAAISGTSGLLRKTAANTWSLETSSYLTGNQTISLSGDVSGSGSTSISATLANSGVTAGTYTNATVTVDAKGRVTSASSGAASGVTSFSAGTTGLTPSTAATGAVTLAGTLAVANGGTGATTASSARSNLGAAASGAVTSSGLTMSTARLLGRTSTSTGAVEEISIGTGLTLSSGTLSSSSANPIPSGTAMLFVQSAAPTGWTKSTTHNDKALRVVSGTASSGGSVAFTTAFASQAVSGTVGNTTLTTAQMPAHSHSGATDTQGNHSHSVNGLYSPGSGGGYSAPNNVDGTSYSFWTTTTAGAHAHNLTTYNSGGGQSHTHAFTGTAINLAVQYVDVIIAMKD